MNALFFRGLMLLGFSLCPLAAVSRTLPALSPVYTHLEPSSTLNREEAEVAAAEACDALRRLTGRHFNFIFAGGESMRPADSAQSVTIYETGCFDDLRVGDVIIAMPEGALKRWVGHRIKKKGARGWWTQGDNCRLPDPYEVTKEKFFGRIVGYIWLRVPSKGAKR